MRCRQLPAIVSRIIDGGIALAEKMVDNFAYLIDTIGFIPNGNRQYYMSRSQPPFFALMVNEISAKDPKKALKYLPALEKEYNRFFIRALSCKKLPA